jgi:hypothetical protein
MRIYRLLTILVVLTMLFSFGRAETRSLAQGQTPPWAANATPSATSPQVRVPSGQPMTTEMMLKHLPKLSAGAAEIVAARLGVTEIAGKKLDFSPRTGLDNVINTDDNTNENEPSLAVNPVNDAIVVAFHHDYPASSECIAMVSYDGGNTFNYYNYVFLPLQAPGDTCSDPVVRFSPDGTVAYYFYMDIAGASDIVMVRAAGYDPTILLDASPIVVLNDYGGFLDKPWGDVAYYDFTGASDGAVYVTATLFDSSGDCGILFNASTDHGNTWTYGDTGLLLDFSGGCNPVVVQGSRPIGSPYSGWVTACWYNSRSDGFLNGQFNINCWSNDAWGNAGLGNNYFFIAVNGMRYELPYYLGPNSTYHRWFGGMFPSLAVDNTGLLYVAFAADPTSNPYDVESGNVYLARGWPIPGGFVAPVPVGTGSTAQGFPTVTARCYTTTPPRCYSYVAYFDHLSSNQFYNVVYRKGTRPMSFYSIGSLGFGGKVKISDVPSWSDYWFIGDYIDSSVISGRRYHVVWTDRADVYGPYDTDDDVMHDMFVP